MKSQERCDEQTVTVFAGLSLFLLVAANVTASQPPSVRR